MEDIINKIKDINEQGLYGVATQMYPTQLNMIIIKRSDDGETTMPINIVYNILDKSKEHKDEVLNQLNQYLKEE